MEAGTLDAERRGAPGARPKPGDALLRSGSALVLSTGLTSAFGVAYWIVAARSYPPRVLGEQSAAISSMLMLSNFAQLNMFFALTRFVPRAGRATARLVGSAYAACATASLLAGTAFVVLAPRVSGRLEYLHSSGWMPVAFVLSVPLWGIFALQDGVLTALHRAPWVAVENAAFGVVKVALLVLLAAVFAGGGIFLSWTLPVVLAVVPVNALVFGRLTRDRPEATAPVTLRGVARFVGVDYVSSLLLQCYTTALPLLIVALLGPAANARFYVAYVVIAAVDLVAVNLATSLVVEAAHDERRLAEYALRVLRRSAVLLIAGVAVLELGAGPLLHVFGHGYAGDSLSLLRLMLLGSVPRMVGIVYMATLRVQRRVGRVVLIQLVVAVLVVALTVALTPAMGVRGVGVAWACAHTAVAVALLPWLLRLRRSAR